MLILCYFEYTTAVKKYQNKTALNCGFGFAIEIPIKSVSLIKVCAISKSLIIILSEIPLVYVQEKENAAGYIYLRRF